MTSVIALNGAPFLPALFAGRPPSCAANSLEILRRSSLASTEKTKTSKTGFYRQPNMQRVRPAQQQIDLRRKQFAQRFMWFSQNYNVPQDDFVDACEYGRRHSSAEVYGRKSILKTSSLESDDGETPSSPRTLTTGATQPELKKQTSFKEQVDVIYYDRRERPISSSSREEEKLKDEHKTHGRITERTLHIPCELHIGENTCNANDDNSTCDCPLDQEPIFVGKNIEALENDDGAFIWRLFVPIGQDYIRNRTSVKALSGGRKLIIVTYRPMTTQGPEPQSYLHQYIERLHLPHPIDAYGVRASMDKDGNLNITAPFLQQVEES